MPSKKKAAKTKSVPKAKAKKPVKQEKKAVSKKPATKKAPTKAKSKTEVKKNTTKKVAVHKAAPKKPIAKALKTKKVVPAKAVKGKAKPVAKPIQSSKKPAVGSKTNKIEKSKAVKAPKVVEKKISPKKVVEKKVAEKKAVVKLPKAPKEPKPIAPEKLKKQEEAALKKQLIEQKSKEVLAINNSIPVAAKNEISLSKIASISHSITNPVKRADSYSIKPEKEPNGKFELEFVVHASAEMIYEFISTPSGLSEWFCDDLNIRNGIYTFIWDDTMQQARLLKTVDLQLVRFQWVDKVDGSYFELRIQRDDLTNDISLMITDFAETVSERESSKLLWHNQIEKLMHVLGSVF